VDAGEVEAMRKAGDFKGLLQIVEYHVVMSEHDDEEWRSRTRTRAARRRAKKTGTYEAYAFKKLLERSLSR
jgi:hypothetical protein